MTAQSNFKPSLTIRKEDTEKPAGSQIKIPPLKDGVAFAIPAVTHVINKVLDREPPTSVHSNPVELFASPMSEER